MKAKKEFYMKYLKDNPKINKTEPINKDLSTLNSKENNNNKKYNEKNNISDLKEGNKNHLNNSFENFVSQIKNCDYTENTKWENPARKYSMNMDKNKNTIKLTELNQINYNNPLLILNKEYIQQKYNPNLFESELIKIEEEIKVKKNNDKKNKKEIKNNSIDILDEHIFFVDKIMERREYFEINTKVLNYYLQYYCNNNYELMTPSINKIREVTKIVDLYYEKIHSKKKKNIFLKKCLLDNTMEIILKKKKFENLTKIYFFLKNNIFTLYKDMKKLKLKTMNYNYIKYYQENNRLLKEIEIIEKNIIKEFNVNDTIQTKLIKFNVIDDIKNKLVKKKEKFNKIYNQEKNNIFNSKKSYIYDLYYLFNIEHSASNSENNNSQGNNTINLFVLEMKKIYKLKSKKMILETVQYFKNKENKNINSVVIFNLNKPKLSELNNIFIEEKKIIPCLSKIFIKLKNHIDIFLYYYNLILSNKKDNIDENFKNEIKSRKNEFYEVLDKHLSKIIILLSNILEKEEKITDFSKKNLLISINLVCLFIKLLKIKFNVKYNKYTNSSLKNFIIKEIKLENKNIIDKVMILLSNDSWEKNILDSSFFKIELIQKRIPFNLKNFISFFNESEIKESLISKLINKENIDDIFNYVTNICEKITDGENKDYTNNINFDEVLNLYSKNEINKLKNEIEKEKEIILFNKPLKYSSLFVTNSSHYILKGIENQIINLIIFESLTFEIFEELFDTIDLYIFICFQMFLKDKNNLSKLLKNLNIKEIQKDLGNLEYWSELISYQKKYLELKKFYVSTEQKFLNIFAKDKEFISEEEKNSFIDRIIPKLKGLNENKNIEEKKLNQNEPDNNKSFNIFSFKSNSISQIIKDTLNKNTNINQNSEQENKINEKYEDEDGIEPLNINQISEINNTNNSNDSNIKEKNEKLKIFNFFRSSNENNFQETPIEELINEIKSKLSNINIKEILILISCLLTLNKILKRLVLFSTKIELELQRYIILNKINKYEKLIEQIRNLFYNKISSEILDFSQVSYLIEEFNWSPNPEEGSKQLFEPSVWVNKLKSLFEVIVCEIHIRFNYLFGEKKLTQYFINLIKFIIECIQDSFAKIKKCNDMGRSIMLKDIKLLKEGIEGTLKKYKYIKNIKTNILFDIIIQYANAWYYNSDDLTKFIFNYNIQYKYSESLINSSPIVNELSNEIKNELINKVNQNYLNQFKKILSKFKDDN